MSCSGRDALVVATWTLLRRCAAEEAHTVQVTALALRLFDELKELHGLAERDRRLLQCGALLHDVGLCEGSRAHHKTAQRIIEEAPELRPFASRERRILGLLARFHRKRPPAADDERLGALRSRDRAAVRWLAGLLRVADGLDRGHRQRVRRLRCRVRDGRLTVRCAGAGDCGAETRAALEKGDLLRDVTGCELRVSQDGEGGGL